MFNRLTNAFKQSVATFRRTFDAAGGSGRWPMAASTWAQNSQSLAARGPIARRSAYLVHNSPAGASFVESWVSNLVGDGPTIRSNHPDDDVRRDLEERFADWSSRCDIEGVDDLNGMLNVAVRSIVSNGEALFHMPVDPSGYLQLRLLSSEQLDSSRTVPSLGMTGDRPRIIAGVESDAAGRRVAFWILRDAPDQVWASIVPSERVPAEDIAHVFVRRFPGQIRGLSWLTPIATRLVELDSLEDAALVKAKVSTLFAGFVKDLDGSSGLAAEATKVDPASISLEPGTLRFLPPMSEVQFTPVADQSTLPDLLRHFQRTIAAGGGLPYEVLSGDMSQVNYSSIRFGFSQFQRRIKAIQGTLLVAQLLAPIWRRWVLLEILTGRISARDFERRPLDYLNCKFLWPGWPAIDPLKQAKADALDLASRTRSRAEIIADHGRDVSDVDSEIETDPLFVTDAANAAALLAQPEEVQNA